MKTDLLLYLPAASGGLAVLYLLYRLLLHRETCFIFNRWFILGGVGLSAVLPLAELPLSQTPLYALPSLPLETMSISPQGQSDLYFDWPTRLVELYAVGILIGAARLLYRLWHVWELARQLPGERRAAYRLIRTGGSLPTFSFFGWLFWDDSQTLSETERAQVMRHEETHIGQRHSLDVLLLEATAVIFWFNPFVYLLGKELRSVHEYLADREALHGTDPGTYVKLVATQALQRLPIGLIQPFHSSPFQNRIRMIRLAQTTRPAIWKLALSISIVTLLSVLYSCRSNEVLQPESLHGNASKQRLTVMGTVSSVQEGNRKRLANAHVLIMGTSVGTVTDQDGTFRLNQVPAGSTLVFSHVGLATQQIPVDPSGKIRRGVVVHDIQLSPTTTELEINNPNAAHSTPDQFTGADGTVFRVVERMPDFKGGFTALGKYLGENIRYPKEAVENKINGTVFVSFIVNADGSVSNPQILKGIGKGCDEEAWRVVQQMPAWIPGMQEGKSVAVRFSLPVKFALN